MGIGNRPDPMEQKREEKRDNPLGLNLVDKIVLENLTLLRKAKEKYTPLVQNLTDMDFAGLFQVVMDERKKRMVRLMMENPAILRSAIDDLNQRIKDEGN